MPSRPDIIFNANEGLFTPLAHKRRFSRGVHVPQLLLP